MPTILVCVPSLLRAAIGNRPHLEVEAATLADLADRLRLDQPRLYAHIFDETGKRRPHLAFFLNDDNITARTDIRLQTGDEIRILPAVSGG